MLFHRSSRALEAGARLVACAATLLIPVAARAVQQPDGKTIPVIFSSTGTCDSGLNVQACLDDSEVSLGGAAGKVGALTNATIDRETFDPGCQLTFKVLSKGGSFYGHAFGWYRVRAGNVPPPLSELNVFLTCAETQMPGTTKVLTLPPGVGTIGFFMASYPGKSACDAMTANTPLPSEPNYTFYTERRFNGLDRAGQPIPNVVPNVIRVLTWQSAVQPGAFYFGWEDDGRNADDNFNDLVTRVSGISCSGGGASCDTGMKGACAAGTMQCRAGVLACVPNQGAVPERCNAVDDNCDGTIDEGNDICPPMQICQQGNCVRRCSADIEFACASGFSCDPNGRCIETACKDVTCPPGQLCRGGHCRGECDGIVCPYGQACRHGGCLDVCATLTCDPGSRCVVQVPTGGGESVGVCSGCPCMGCPAGSSCIDNACVPTNCADVNCPAGTHCQARTCVDSCAGAQCPTGSSCRQGQCMIDQNGSDAGPDSRAPGSMAPDAGGSPTGGAGGDTRPPTISPSSGCRCDLPAGTKHGNFAAMVLSLALAAWGTAGRKK
ncbi:MAG TPA: DUF4114 domain-containing protein [Polyangia bacterium]|nr:DUF4114 domain-containing protein [Polyangia bacterium]